MAYLHGAKLSRTGSLLAGGTTLTSQVIGLVGVGSTANKYNEPTLVTNITQARKLYGGDVGGTTIMSALETIYSHIANAKVVVVNVLNSTKLPTVIDSVTSKTKKAGTDWCTAIHQSTIPATTGYVNLTTDITAGLDKLKTAETIVGEKI